MNSSFDSQATVSWRSTGENLIECRNIIEAQISLMLGLVMLQSASHAFDAPIAPAKDFQWQVMESVGQIMGLFPFQIPELNESRMH